MIKLEQLPGLHKELFIEGVWSKEYINKLIEEPSNPEDYPNALIDIFNCLLDINLDNKNILVVGSITPWIECYLINLGANHVFITDINEIKINDNRISFINLSNLSEKKFDIIVSFSTVEHIGLGRYGDPIDENGDINFMNESVNLLTDNGVFILSIPVAEKYIIEGIWHRIYDENRLKILFEKYDIKKSSKNNKLSDYVDFTFDNFYQYGWQNQPVILLMKKK